MFTPPASPPAPIQTRQEDTEPATRKHRIRWTVLIIPLALIAIAASTRSITHPAAFDVLSGQGSLPLNWHTSTDWRPHKRHPANDDGDESAQTLSSEESQSTDLAQASSTVASATPAATAQSVPIIPTDPDLPSPFPQPFDSDITQNYSSMTCFNFFMNMTSAAAFRQCRPFSVLLQTSSAFIDTQTNLTELNTVLWGTCNPPLGVEQCTSNMDWFATSLQDACAVDIADESDLVTSTLTALKAYKPMYDAACQSDPMANTYCYVNAIHNPNPSDVYFYHLPLGISVPNTSTPSCSACTKSVMNVYAAAYPDSEALHKTYSHAQEMADTACGEGYAPSVAASTGSGALLVPNTAVPSALVLALLTIFTLQ